MWLIGRLLLFIFGFAIRFFNKSTPGVEQETLKGTPYREHIAENRYGKLLHTTLYIPLQNSYYFKLTPETTIDRFFKLIGFSEEFQTDNKSFDDKIYIASDHPYIYQLLQTTPALQKIILKLFKDKIIDITNSGHFLSIKSKSKQDVESIVPKLRSIAEILESKSSQIDNRFQDRYFYKVLAIESLIWSIAFYSIGSITDFCSHQKATYIQTADIIRYGLYTSLLFFVLLFILTRFILAGSSRGHRILVETAIVLLLSLPIASLQAVSDINIYLDKKPPIVINNISIIRRWDELHRSRGYSYYTYHIEISTLGLTTLLPSVIKVNKKVYDSLYDEPISIEIGKGYFNIPWYKKINNREA